VGVVTGYSEVAEECFEMEADGVAEPGVETWTGVLDSGTEEESWWLGEAEAGVDAEWTSVGYADDDGDADEAWLLVG
jgi:hypothetical protein